MQSIRSFMKTDTFRTTLQWYRKNERRSVEPLHELKESEMRRSKCKLEKRLKRGQILGQTKLLDYQK